MNFGFGRWVSTIPVIGLALAVLLALAPRNAHAQATPYPPGQISYQGFLTDANGFPLATNNPVNYNVVFRIYSTSSGSSGLLWTELQIVTVDRGYFTVMLGNGSSYAGGPFTNNLTSIFSGSNASDRYLEITVLGLAPGDPPILPRLRLLSSPYSLLASRAMSVDSTTAIADGNLSANVALRNGGNTFNGNQIVNNRLGIGTAAPGQGLQVGDPGVVGAQGLIRLAARSSTGGSANRTWDIGVPQAGDVVSGTSYSFVINDVTGLTTPFMVQWGSGNVGIGSTNPANRLEVKNAFVGDGLNLWGSAPAFYLSDVNKIQQGGWGYAANAGNYSSDAAAGDVVFRANSGRLLLQNGSGVSGLAINNNSVGIGTPAPAAKLDVRGDVKMTGGSGGNTVYASGGMEDLRIVRGTVRSDGSIFNGAGFTVTRNGTGSFTLNFNPTFGDVPAVTVTPAPNAGLPCTATWNNGNYNNILIETWSGSTHADLWFMFQAIGAR